MPVVEALAVTTPDVLLTPAINTLLLLQVPPLRASLKVVTVPMHKEVLPEIAAAGLMVTVVIAGQPEDSV